MRYHIFVLVLHIHESYFHGHNTLITAIGLNMGGANLLVMFTPP